MEEITGMELTVNALDTTVLTWPVGSFACTRNVWEPLSATNDADVAAPNAESVVLSIEYAYVNGTVVFDERAGCAVPLQLNVTAVDPTVDEFAGPPVMVTVGTSVVASAEMAMVSGAISLRISNPVCLSVIAVDSDISGVIVFDAIAFAA